MSRKKLKQLQLDLQQHRGPLRAPQQPWPSLSLHSFLISSFFLGSSQCCVKKNRKNRWKVMLPTSAQVNRVMWSLASCAACALVSRDTCCIEWHCFDTMGEWVPIKWKFESDRAVASANIFVWIVARSPWVVGSSWGIAHPTNCNFRIHLCTKPCCNLDLSLSWTGVWHLCLKLLFVHDAFGASPFCHQDANPGSLLEIFRNMMLARISTS